MKKYLDWIIVHKVKTGFIVFGLFIFPLILIHFLYKWTTPHYLLQSSWSSGELITYIAGFEAFLGTILLGSATVYLNSKANETNNNMLKNEEKRDVFDRQSSAMLVNHEMYIGSLKDFESTKSGVFQCISVPYFNIPDDECILTLTLVNSSKSFTILKVLAIDSFLNIDTPSAFHCLMNCVCGQKTSLIDIAPGKECKIHFATTLEAFAKFECAVLNLKLQLTNSIGEIRNERISFVLVKLHDDVLSMNSIRYFFEP